MMMFFASISADAPSPFTAILFGVKIVPDPLKTLTLFFRKRKSTPFAFLSTMSLLRAWIFPKSISISPVLNSPCWDAFLISWRRCASRNRDLVGMQPRSKRLVAYVVAEAKTSVSELRQSLQERLPEYMIPSAFVMLEEMPLTVNGKVDRRALPAPDRSRPKLEKVYVAPRNEREEKLAGIWSQVLGLEKVGVHDNFFELGGDSIRSIQVIGKMTQIGMLISTRQIHDHPTVAELASAVSESEPEEVFDSVPLVDLSDEKLNQLLEQVEFYA